MNAPAWVLLGLVVLVAVMPWIIQGATWLLVAWLHRGAGGRW